jgi:hypothetical protein
LDIFTWVVLFKTTAYYPTKTTALYFFLQGVNLSRYQGVILKWQTGVTLIWRTGVNLSGFSRYSTSYSFFPLAFRQPKQKLKQ